MAELTADLTLADLVNATPAAARTLELHGLDYCCGGAKRLDDACAEAGIDPDAVLQELAGSDDGSTPDWDRMSLGELVDHVESSHHGYLHSEMPRLSALAEKVAAVHGANHPELHEVRTTYEALRTELDPHLATEEQTVFPAIRAVGSSEGSDPEAGIAEAIATLMVEHERAGELLTKLRELTVGYATPSDGCASYRGLYDGLAELERDTHLHVHKENNILFPAVLGRGHDGAHDLAASRPA
jgi:regulator of cell morphogenesis and NO signaling